MTATGTTRASARPGGPRPAVSLAAAARAFSSHASPRIIAAALAAAVAARAALGGWSWWDLLGPAVLLAAEPFTEWAIHVRILHRRPRRMFGRVVDYDVSRKHRLHHADPTDPVLVLVPIPTLLALIGGLGLALVLAPPLRPGLSTLVAGYAMLFVYEWTHHLIHSTYRPRHRLYRSVWRAHRLHHFRNEHYWFGVTMHLADHVLSTYPGKLDVELSPTARTLGVDAA